MAVTADKVIVRLEAKVDQYMRDMARSQARFDRNMGDMRRSADRMEANVSRSMRQAGQSAGRMSRDIRTAISGVALGLAIREVTQYADAWTEAGNKIAAAGTPLDKQGERLSELADLAIDTRSAFDATASLYARLGIATETLTDKNYDLLKVTELINKATVAGGASTGERNSTVLQLSQALASGELMGEELRSLRENAPILLRAIAKEFEVPIGALKELGAEGKLTSERILEAILNAEGEIAARFAKTDVTISDSLENLKTRLTQYIGTADDGLSASEKLAGAINYVAENVDAFVEGLVVVTAALIGAFGAQAVASAVAGLASITKGATLASRALAVLRASALTALGPLGLAVGAASAALAYYLLQTGKAVDATSDYASQAENLKSALDRYVEAQKTANELSGAAKENAEAVAQAARAEAQAVLDAADAKIADAKAIIAQAKARREAAIMPGSVAMSGKDSLQMRPQRNVAQANREIEQQLANIATLEQAVLSARETLAADPATIGISAPSAGASTGTSDKRDKDREAALKALADIEDAQRQLYTTEREQIDYAHQERLKTIASLKATNAEKDAAIVQSAQIRDAELAELDKSEAERKQKAKEQAQADRDREISFMQQVMESRDQMTGRLASILEREYSLKRNQIMSELSDKEEQNQALLALEEERIEAEKQLRDELLGEGSFSDDQLERFRSYMEDRQTALADGLELERITWEEYLQELAELKQEYRDIEREQEIDNQQTILSATAGFLSTMTSLAEQRFGKSSALRQAFFIAEKIAAAAQVMLNAEVAKIRALAELGPIAGPPAAAAIEVAKNISLATIAAQTVAGFKDGVIGLNGPGTGTSDSIPARLSRGESVITERGTRLNRNLLEQINRGVDIEGQLARLTQPISINAPFMASGGRPISIGGSSITINGPVNDETLPALRAEVDRMNRDMERRIEKVVERDRMRTTPRHERSRFLKG